MRIYLVENIGAGKPLLLGSTESVSGVCVCVFVCE